MMFASNPLQHIFTGNKVFSSVDPKASTSFKFVSMVAACTGGGILVPIFVNNIPVPLVNDYYIIAILIAFTLHSLFPMLRDVYKLSDCFKISIVILFETLRASVVCALLSSAQNAIPPSAFSFALFGPIMCGTVAGCGGAFFPLNKGLDPIKEGLQSPMFTAMIASACYHIYTSTRLSDGCMDARKKAQVHIAAYFIFVGTCNAFGIAPPKPSDSKKES